MSTALDHQRDDEALAEDALNVVAAKAWGTLVGGDLTRRDTWDQEMAWVRIGQRLVDDPAPEVVARINPMLPSGRTPDAPQGRVSPAG